MKEWFSKMKKRFYIFSTLIVLVLMAHFLAGRIIGTVLSIMTRNLTGFEVSVGQVNLNIISGQFLIKNLKIMNPPEFPERILTDIPEIGVDINWKDSLARRMIHLKRFTLNLQELNVVKNELGVSNLSKLQSIGPKEEQKKTKSSVGNAQAMAFMIDEFRLTFRRVRYVEFKAGALPKRLEFDLRIDNLVYHHIDDPNTLVKIIVLKVMYETTLGRIGLGIDAGKLYSDLQGTVGKGVQLAKEKIQNVKELGADIVPTSIPDAKKTMGSIFSKGKDAIKGVSKVIVGDSNQ